MSRGPSSENQSITSPAPRAPHAQDPDLGKLLHPESTAILRQPKIKSLGDDETKQIIRTARSGSIKNKLNLENARLKINIDNLNTLLSVHQNNEAKFKQELDKYRDKILRYKDKIKEKDTIIAKLLSKLQKKIQIDGRNLENMVIRMHEQHLKAFKGRLGRGENIDINDVLTRYEELLKIFNKQEKDRLYMEKEKEQLEGTVKELRDTILYVGEGKVDTKGIERENERVKARLMEAQALLEKEKAARNHLLELIQSHHNLQLKSQTRSILADLQRARSSLTLTNLPLPNNPLQSHQLSTLKQKLAQSETNLFRERETRRNTEKHCGRIEENLQALSRQLVGAQGGLQGLNNRVEKIQQVYMKEIEELERKTRGLLQDSTNIETYRAHIDDMSKKFNQTITKFSQQSSKWTMLENTYQEKLDQYRLNKRTLQDRLQKQQQKRKIFQLKLMGHDDRNGGRTVQELKPEDMGLYLDERVEGIWRDGDKLRKENQGLKEELARNLRAYEILEREVKDAEEKIYKLEHLLKKYSISLEGTHQEPPRQHPYHSPNLATRFDKNSPPESLPHPQPQPHTQLLSLTTPQLQQRIIQAEQQNKYLEEHLRELRGRCIDLQMRVDEKDREIGRLVEKVRKIEGQGQEQRRILDRAEPGLGKTTNEGGYNVNIANELPAQIQKMSFEQLASRYLSAKDQLLYLKQKIQWSQSQPQQPQWKTQQKQSAPLQMILSQTENQPEDGNSQQIDDATYKSINQEMDRLIHKNKDLSSQLALTKQELQQQIANLQQSNTELKNKIKSAEEINTSLSNIVVHLEAELSRYQNNLDNSMLEQRGSQVMEGSGKRERDGGVNEIAKRIEDKRREFQEMLKSGSSQNQRQSRQYQNHLKNLQLQIRALQQQKDKPQNPQKPLHHPSPQPQPQSPTKSTSECPNCQNLTKLTSQLIQKLNKLQEEKEQKIASYRTELEQLQANVQQPAIASGNSQELVRENQNLRRLIAQLKTQFLYQTKQQQQYQNQIKNLHQINQQLVNSIHEKQKQMLKLRTDIYRQNYDASGAHGYGQYGNEQELKKIDDIIQAYESKIEGLEALLKGQERNQVNISDLYDTINYLNSQCEDLRKKIQLSANSSQVPPIQPIPTLSPHQYQPPIPLSHPQLATQYKTLHAYLSSLQQSAQNSNYPSIQQLIKGAEQQKMTNIDLMRENARLQNKITGMGAQYDEYFRKIGEGRIGEILGGKEKEVEGLRAELEAMAREREKMYTENEKISRDLKAIQSNIEKLTGGKPTTSLQSTLATDLPKTLEKTLIISPKQPQQTLSLLSRRLEILKTSILSSSHKNRPSFPVRPFPELPSIEQVIIILQDRLHYAWNLVEERTTQYNQLRDEMNIISMECMKNGTAMYEADGKLEKSESRVRDADIIEQRYEQVLAQLVEYQNQNKRLEREVTRLKTQIGQYKKQVEQAQSRYLYEMKSQSSQQVPYNKQLLNKLLDSHSSMVNVPVSNPMPEIFKLFLGRIKELEGNLETIEGEFDEKNRRLESLIQKEKSFLSQKSRINKQSDQSSNQIKKQPLLSDRQKPQPQRGMTASLSPNPITASVTGPYMLQSDDKSYSLNSARVFKQIQELTRMNEELRDKKYKYRGILESVVKVLEVVLARFKGKLEEKLKVQMENILGIVNTDFEEEAKKDNSGFDLEGDYILSSSFAQKAKGSVKVSNQEGLEQIENTLQSAKSMHQRQKTNKKVQQANTNNKKLQQNLKFLNENKFLLEDLLNKIHELRQTPSLLNFQQVKARLAASLTDKQLQELLYISDVEQSMPKIMELLEHTTTPVKKTVSFEGEKGEESVEEGEWVETQQLEAIINKIYPNKSELCLIVANSINMLMLAETKEGILRAVEFLFTNLKKKQAQIRQELKKRDQSVTEYGRKMQKLLLSKHSQEQSLQKSDLLNQNSFRKTTQFKSEYELKKQEDKQKDRKDLSQSNSQSFSEYFKEK